MGKQRTLGIFGSGSTGQACANHALAQGDCVVLFDQAHSWYPRVKTAAFRCQVGPTLQASDLDGLDEVIVSPGLSIFHPWIVLLGSVGIPYGSDIDYLSQYTQVPMIGVTGTNGKSTVCTLLAHAASLQGMKAFAGGNLGPPAITLLQHRQAELFILEFSSALLSYSQTYRLQAGVILNIGVDHLDWHQSLEHYQQSKLAITHHAKHAIVPNGWTHLATSEHVHAYDALISTAQKCLQESEVLMPVENLAACMAVGEVLGWPISLWPQALATFSGLPHRLQRLHNTSSWVWYNDSKGTNFDATAFAAKALHAKDAAPFWWLAGGLFKTLDLTLMAPWLDEAIAGVVVFGPQRQAFAQQVRAKWPHMPLFEVVRMEDAIQTVSQQADEGMRILFSPGGSSFDAFTDYAERGRAFTSLVDQLE